MLSTTALEKSSQFLKSHKTEVALALGIVGAFFVGRGCQPQPTVVEKTVVEYKDRIVEKLVEVEKRVEVKGKDRIVYREKITTPDGTVTEKETEKESERSTNTETKEVVKEVVRTVEIEKEVIKTVSAQPRFKVGALIGYDALRIQSGPRGIDLNGAVIGLQADVRLVGPVWLGVQAQSNGVFSGAIGVTF